MTLETSVGIRFVEDDLGASDSQKPVDFDQFRQIIKSAGGLCRIVNQPPPDADASAQG